MRRFGVVALLLSLTVAVAGCGVGPRPRAATVDERPPFSPAQASSVTVVEMDDFSITPTATTIVGRRVLLDVRNGSAHGYLHELVVTQADQDDEAPSLGEVQVATDQRRPLALELEPGRYQFACFLKTKNPDGTETEHFLRKMKVDVTVTG